MFNHLRVLLFAVFATTATAAAGEPLPCDQNYVEHTGTSAQHRSAEWPLATVNNYRRGVVATFVHPLMSDAGKGGRRAGSHAFALDIDERGA